MIETVHVVFVSSLVPVSAPASGFDIANRVVVDALRASGARVSLVGCALPEDAVAYPSDTTLLARLEVVNARVSRARKLKWLAMALARNVPFSSAKMLGIGAGTLRLRLGELEPFDGLILNSVQLPGAFPDVFTRYPFIFLAHNVEARSARENAESATTALERALYRREARKLDSVESRLCRDARHIWTFSEEDRCVLSNGDANRSSVLPLVTTLEPPEPRPEKPPVFDLGLIGTWTWQPNRVGLDWFLQKVVPHLDDGVSIAIAGNVKEPPPVAHPGVRFVGRVGDARAFMRKAAVAPLISRNGTGIQLKTIEALEMDLPVVATSSALRGLDGIPENCVRADEPERFAVALMEQIERARGTNSQAESGRRFHAGRVRSLVETVGNDLSAFLA